MLNTAACTVHAAFKPFNHYSRASYSLNLCLKLLSSKS
jgi:hypothetical protein